jgi:hypothetical protein
VGLVYIGECMKYILITLLLILTSCTDKDDAIRILSQQGYTEITITGYDYGACGKDDKFSTGFTALNLNNKVVRGTVCKGFLLKGSTIRLK